MRSGELAAEAILGAFADQSLRGPPLPPPTSARCGAGWRRSSGSSTSTTSRRSSTCSCSPQQLLRHDHRRPQRALGRQLPPHAPAHALRALAPRSPSPASTPGPAAGRESPWSRGWSGSASRAAPRRRRGEPRVELNVGDRRLVTMTKILRGYAFTIAGIAIGVAGLVALGAMGERIVRFIEGGDRFVLGQISVAGRGMGMGAGFTAGGLLPAARRSGDRRGARRRRRAAAGDAAAQSHDLAVHDPHPGAGPRRGPHGADAQPSLSGSCPCGEGRFLRQGDRRVAVVGASFAASHGLRRGRPADARGRALRGRGRAASAC